MKKPLSLLVAFMFLQTQMWALSGGPVFTTPASPDLTGTYAGTFIGKSTTTPPGFPLGVLTPASTGVFSITVPIVGPATGTTVLFQANVAYTGTITASANPGNRTINGIIQVVSTQVFTVIPAIPATLPVTTIVVLPPFFVPTAVTVPGIPAQAAVTTPLFATGSMKTSISGVQRTRNTGNEAVNGVARSAGSSGGRDALGNPVSLGAIGDRMTGTAIINALFQNTAIVGPATTANSTRYTVSGIRQTNVVGVIAPTP